MYMIEIEKTRKFFKKTSEPLTEPIIIYWDESFTREIHPLGDSAILIIDFPSRRNTIYEFQNGEFRVTGGVMDLFKGNKTVLKLTK